MNNQKQRKMLQTVSEVLLAGLSYAILAKSMRNAGDIANLRQSLIMKKRGS
ncbi:hypothetical protein BLGI_3099 [Brevibacillus laterosporus GI-9]|nr:hypothetical protein BLGI_3099 [Brevibacillus laterosporus GI-9]